MQPPPPPPNKGLRAQFMHDRIQRFDSSEHIILDGKICFEKKNDKTLHWLAILNEDERKTCWNPGLIFQKNHRLITFTFLELLIAYLGCRM